MKNKFLVAIAWLFMGLATIGGKLAYADMAQTSSASMSLACAADNDWNFNDPICHPGIAGGKAAYGEPSTSNVPTTHCLAQLSSGNDWNFDPECNPRLSEGKAAYGESTGGTSVPSSYCMVQQSNGNDWNFNDPTC